MIQLPFYYLLLLASCDIHWPSLGFQFQLEFQALKVPELTKLWRSSSTWEMPSEMKRSSRLLGQAVPQTRWPALHFFKHLAICFYKRLYMIHYDSMYKVLKQNTNTMFNTCHTYYIIINLYISILQITPIYPTPFSILNRLTSAKGLSVSYPTASFDIRRVRNRITLLHELRGCLVSLALLDRNMAPPAVKIGGEHVATLSVNVVHMI